MYGNEFGGIKYLDGKYLSLKKVVEGNKILDLIMKEIGSKEDAFYEKCGYKAIFQIQGQNIYQKIL